MRNKAQVTIFIILAIIIVALATLFFVFKDRLLPDRIPSDINPIHNTFVSCLEEDLT
jgi:hypothetical protein